jgi:hypothetical protein
MKSFQEKATKCKKVKLRFDGNVPCKHSTSVDNARIFIHSGAHAWHSLKIWKRFVQRWFSYELFFNLGNFWNKVSLPIFKLKRQSLAQNKGKNELHSNLRGPIWKVFKEKQKNAKKVKIRVDGNVPCNTSASVDNARIFIPSHCHTRHSLKLWKKSVQAWFSYAL